MHIATRCGGTGGVPPSLSCTTPRIPSLAQRPSGFTRTHIANLEAFYRDKQGWSAGPHLFIDDRQIWVFTRLTVSGIHSPSWNKLAFGVEMLGDYEREAFDQGRGLKVRAHTVCAIATLCAVTGIDPASLKLHREDTLTTHACPGSKVDKGAVIKEIQDVIVSRHGGDHGQPGPQARVAARQADQPSRSNPPSGKIPLITAPSGNRTSIWPSPELPALSILTTTPPVR